MPISFEINGDPETVTFQVTIPISVEEFVAGYELLFADKNFKVNVPVIWDFSSLDLKRVPISDIRQLPLRLKQFMSDRGDDYKAALVTNGAMDYQLLRLYITIMRLLGSNFHMRLFRTLEEAKSWIAR